MSSNNIYKRTFVSSEEETQIISTKSKTNEPRIRRCVFVSMDPILPESISYYTVAITGLGSLFQ